LSGFFLKKYELFVLSKKLKVTSLLSHFVYKVNSEAHSSLCLHGHFLIVPFACWEGCKGSLDGHLWPSKGWPSNPSTLLNTLFYIIKGSSPSLLSLCMQREREKSVLDSHLFLGSGPPRWPWVAFETPPSMQREQVKSDLSPQKGKKTQTISLSKLYINNLVIKNEYTIDWIKVLGSGVHWPPPPPILISMYNYFYEDCFL
jgi:hypothetical protein